MLEGTGDLDFVGENGRRFGVLQSPFEASGPTPDLVVLAPGDQASLPLRYSSAPVGEASPYCPPPLTARVLLPVDDEPVTAALASGEPMPPLCGEEVRIGPWRY